jgi:hypothetical protein
MSFPKSEERVLTLFRLLERTLLRFDVPEHLEGFFQVRLEIQSHQLQHHSDDGIA